MVGNGSIFWWREQEVALLQSLRLAHSGRKHGRGPGGPGKREKRSWRLLELGRGFFENGHDIELPVVTRMRLFGGARCSVVGWQAQSSLHDKGPREMRCTEEEKQIVGARAINNHNHIPGELRAAGLIVALSALLGWAEYMSAATPTRQKVKFDKDVS